MRKTWAAVLILLGAFLIALAALTRFYAAGAVLKTPLNVDTTTHLAGTATLGKGSPFPVKATSITRADSAKSDGSVVVFENSSCVVKDVGNPPNCVPADDPQKRLISATTDKFATDRNTGMAVQDRKYVSADSGEHHGLVNKWPFESKQQAYSYWDGTINHAVNAVYKGESTILGLKVYHYQSVTKDEPVQLVEGVQGTYSSTKNFYVEPLTGAIVNQTEDQQRLDEQGKNFLSLHLAFTPSQVKTSVDDAKANVSKLNLIRTIVPLGSLILGLILLVPGILLWRRAYR